MEQACRIIIDRELDQTKFFEHMKAEKMVSA